MANVRTGAVTLFFSGGRWLALGFSEFQPRLEEFSRPFLVSVRADVAFGNLTLVSWPLCLLWTAAVFVLSMDQWKDTCLTPTAGRPAGGPLQTAT